MLFMYIEIVLAQELPPEEIQKVLRKERTFRNP